MSERGTLHAIAHHLTLAFEPLRVGFADFDSFQRMMLRLGWEVTALPPAYSTIANEAADLVATASALGENPALEDVLPVVIAAGDVARSIEALAAAPPGVNAEEFLAELPERLVEFLLVEYLARSLPGLHAFFEMSGVIVREHHPAAGGRPGYVRSELRYAEIPKILSEPQTLPERIYGWGTNDIEFELLSEHLLELFLALGVRASLEPIEPALGDALQRGDADERVAHRLRLPVFETSVGGEVFDVGLSLTELPAEPPEKAGVILLPDLPAALAFQYDVADDLTFTVRAGSDIATQFGIALRPGGVEVRYPFAPGAILPSAGFGATLAHHPAAPVSLIGQPNASRLELAGLAGSFGLDFRSGELELSLGFDVTGLAVVISPGETDDFMAQIFGGQDLRVEVPFGLSWSNRKGLDFSAALGLEVSLRPHLELGPLTIDSVDLAIRAGAVAGAPPAISLAAGLGLTFALGPLAASVSGLGLELALEFERGNAGPFDVDYHFRPPNGIGLSMSTDTVRLGGFLKLDFEKGTYAGAVEISIKDVFSLSAVGLLTTKLPGGEPGFSLLFIVSTTFPTPIHIAYNFYLAGVGGLLGLHRSTDIDRLRAGVQGGTVDNILFPTDVVRNMDAIISDLEAVFPVAKDQFLIGPMALLTWSTPPLITAQVGLIIEFANPVRLALLGVLRAAIPNETDPILDLKVNFLGAIDFERGLLSFDASIYDSYIGRGDFRFSFEGDIALRISWGAHPDFVTSVGGFHPLFKPAAHLKLPSMKRITLSLLKDNPRLKLTSYFAITTNTVQFGAELDFYFKVSKFKVVGIFGFDVLFQFSPFRFIANVRAMLAVKVGDSDLLSLSLEFELQGTTPWIAKGKAKFKILFFSVSVSFEKTFGDRQETALPSIEVLPLLLTEFERDTAFKAELSAGASALVQLRPIERVADHVVVDGAGVLTVAQSAVPLETELTLFNNAEPADLNQASVYELRIGGERVSADDATDSFAPAAFRKLEDRDKLSASAYELRPSGARASGDSALRTSGVVHRPVSFEVIVSDADPADGVDLDRPLPRTAELQPASVFVPLAEKGAVSRAQQSKARAREKERGSVLNLTLDQERFAVVSAGDLTPVEPNAIGLSRSEAEARLRAFITEGADSSDLLIVPQYRLTG